MVVTTVLAYCPDCKHEVEAKILNCDTCFETYLQLGGNPDTWSDLECSHLECLECETLLD